MPEPSVLIAEDEAPQRAALVELLASVWPEARIVAICADGREALQAFEAHRPDVAFLDIRMPGLDGLELARRYSDHTHVVFVTAYDDHALSAYERGAVGYLLKPIARARLELEVRRLRARIADRIPPVETLRELVEALRSSVEPEPERLRWITASIGETMQMFPISEVLAFRSRDKYTEVVTAAGDAIIRKSLKELLGVLDPDEFWQVHRSAVVRASAIDRVERDEGGRFCLRLRGSKEVLPVSAAFRARLRGM